LFLDAVKLFLIGGCFYGFYFSDFFIDPSILNVPIKMKNAVPAMKKLTTKVEIMRLYLFGGF